MLHSPSILLPHDRLPNIHMHTHIHMKFIHLMISWFLNRLTETHVHAQTHTHTCLAPAHACAHARTLLFTSSACTSVCMQVSTWAPHTQTCAKHMQQHTHTTNTVSTHSFSHFFFPYTYLNLDHAHVHLIIFRKQSYTHTHTFNSEYQKKIHTDECMQCKDSTGTHTCVLTNFWYIHTHACKVHIYGYKVSWHIDMWI